LTAKGKSEKPFLVLACFCLNVLRLNVLRLNVLRLNVLRLNVLRLNVLRRLFGACPSEKRRSSGHLAR